LPYMGIAALPQLRRAPPDPEAPEYKITSSIAIATVQV
jgi:hypothetical protein